MDKHEDRKTVHIQSPFGDFEYSFKLNKDANIAIVLRKLNRRQKKIDLMIQATKKLQRLKKENNVYSLEEEAKSIGDKEELTDEDKKRLLDIGDKYPQKVIDIQNEALAHSDDIFELGLDICAMILSPVEPIPKEFDSMLSFISAIMTNDDEVTEIINFFLESSDFTGISHRGSTVRIK